jgi:hypothetical protein
MFYIVGNKDFFKMIREKVLNDFMDAFDSRLEANQKNSLTVYLIDTKDFDKIKDTKWKEDDLKSIAYKTSTKNKMSYARVVFLGLTKYNILLSFCCNLDIRFLKILDNEKLDIINSLYYNRRLKRLTLFVDDKKINGAVKETEKDTGFCFSLFNEDNDQLLNYFFNSFEKKKKKEKNINKIMDLYINELIDMLSGIDEGERMITVVTKYLVTYSLKKIKDYYLFSLHMYDFCKTEKNNDFKLYLKLNLKIKKTMENNIPRLSIDCFYDDIYVTSEEKSKSFLNNMKEEKKLNIDNQPFSVSYSLKLAHTSLIEYCLMQCYILISFINSYKNRAVKYLSNKDKKRLNGDYTSFNFDLKKNIIKNASKYRFKYIDYNKSIKKIGKPKKPHYRQSHTRHHKKMTVSKMMLDVLKEEILQIHFNHIDQSEKKDYYFITVYMFDEQAIFLGNVLCDVLWDIVRYKFRMKGN